MNLTQAKNALKFIIEAETVHKVREIPRPVLVGDSGIGKSSIIRELFYELFKSDKAVLVEKHLSQLEVGDIIGMVDIDKSVDKTVWRAPCWWPSADRCGILFLDEFGDVKNDVQKAAQQLLLERKIYEHILPDGMVTILAMNPGTEEFGSYDFSRQLKNRLMFWKIEPSMEEWLQYSHKRKDLIEGIDKVVSCNNALFHDKTDFSVDLGFCNPRSVTAAAALAKIITPEQAEEFGFQLFSSICGPNMAGHMLRLINKSLDEDLLPFNLNDLMKSAEACSEKINKWESAGRAELIYESVSLVTSQLKESAIKHPSEEQLSKLVKFTGMLPKEHSIAFRQSIAKFDKVLALKLQMGLNPF